MLKKTLVPHTRIIVRAIVLDGNFWSGPKSLCKTWAYFLGCLEVLKNFSRYMYKQQQEVESRITVQIKLFDLLTNGAVHRNLVRVRAWLHAGFSFYSKLYIYF